MSRWIAGAARALALVLLGLFTAVIALLFVSAFTTGAVSMGTRVGLGLVAVLALVHPASGLLVLAALLPLAEVVAPMSGTPDVRGAEALVLAGLTGVMARAWARGQLRRFPEGRLETIALVFGLVVAASCVEQVWLFQLQRDFPERFLPQLLEYLRHEYLMGLGGGFGMIFSAMLLLEGAALVVWAGRVSRHHPAVFRRVTVALALSAAAAAGLNVADMWSDFVSSGRPLGDLAGFALSGRRAIHVADINAAASFFALGLTVAVGQLALHRRSRPLWIGAAALIALALWMTGSRAGLVAVLLVAPFVVVQTWPGLRAHRIRSLAVSLGVSIVLLGALLTVPTRVSDPEEALWLRWHYLGATVRMLEWQPLSGVGVGQYAQYAPRFMSPEVRRGARRENAHNNFSQVVGELGVVGLAAFLALLATAMLRWQRAVSADAAATAGLGGLAAFLLTSLTGHPLLVPAMAFPFWILLGAAHVPRSPESAAVPTLAGVARDRRPAVVVMGAVVAVLLAAWVPARVAAKAEGIDWTSVEYGFHDWERIGRERFRWMTGRARFHLPGSVTALRLPLRALATPDEPMELGIVINGRPVERVRMESWDYVVVQIPLAGPPPSGYWRVDLEASRTWVPAEGNPAGGDHRTVSVFVGEPRITDAQDRERPRRRLPRWLR